MLYRIYLDHPIVHVAINKDSFVFAGLATGEIVAINMPNNQSGVVGGHDAAICKIFWIE
jgi:hypothetical protein